MTGAQKSTQNAKVNVANDGVVLSGTFDRASSTFAADVEAFGAQLAKLQKQRGFTHFLRAIKEEGSVVVIKIVPAKPDASAEDLAALGDGAEIVEASAGAFEAGSKAGRAVVERAAAAAPAPPADEKLAAELKKALFIPRR